MPPPRALRVLEPANAEPESVEVAAAMRAYAGAHQIDELLRVLLADLLEKQPLDPLEHLITALAHTHPALDALEERARAARFDLRREKTKRAIVNALFRRLVALEHRDTAAAAAPEGGELLSRRFLLSQLRLRETQNHLQELFPTHARDLVRWFLAHETRLPPALSPDTFADSCMAVLATMATAG